MKTVFISHRFYVKKIKFEISNPPYIRIGKYLVDDKFYHTKDVKNGQSFNNFDWTDDRRPTTFPYSSLASSHTMPRRTNL